jgi:hypothetical protein
MDDFRKLLMRFKNEYKYDVTVINSNNDVMFIMTKDDYCRLMFKRLNYRFTSSDRRSIHILYNHIKSALDNDTHLFISEQSIKHINKLMNIAA